MIDAKDLRIGNCILSPDTGEYVVVELSHIKAVQDGVKFNDKYYEPIPLTPKVLEMCGFTQSVNHHLDYYKDTQHGINFFSFRLGRPFKHGSHWWPEIKYLHQLQNIYFAITGEELIYTPY